MFGHFGAIFGHFWPFLAILGPIEKWLQTSHVTTQNDRKRSRNPMEMVLDVIFQTFRPVLVIWGLFGHFWPFFSQFWPQTQTCRKLVMWPLKMIAREAEIQWRWFQMSLFRYSDHVRSFWAFFGHFWPLLANFGPKVKIVINWSYDHSKQSQDEQKSNGD